MLRGCVRLNEKQKKVLLVVWCTVALLVLLALLEPGYQKICTYTDHPYHEYCAFYNVVAAALWHIGDGLNYFGPAIAGVSTVAVAVFTWTLWRSTDRAGEHFRVTERAYVKMSHISNMRPKCTVRTRHNKNRCSELRKILCPGRNKKLWAHPWARHRCVAYL